MMNSLKNYRISTASYLRQSWRQILAVHLIFVALGFIVFAPLVGLTGRLLISLSGQAALADQDIAYFLLTPLGLLALILFAALLLCIVALEQAVLMRLAVGRMRSAGVSIADGFLFTSSQLQRLFLFIVRLVIKILLLTLPFLALGAAIAHYLITDYDINYYLTETPAEFWTAAILIGVVLLVMLGILIRKLLDWSLALPFVLFADISPAESFAESIRIAQPGRGLIFYVLLAWSGLFVLAGLVLVVIVRLTGSWLLPSAGESIIFIALILGGLSLLWMVGNVLISSIASGSFAYLIMGLYTEHGGTIQLAKPASSPKEDFLGTFKLSSRGLMVSFVALLAVAGLLSAWLIGGVQTSDNLVIVAHRGAAGKAPENTLASFMQAIEDKADWIEFDVQELADGEIVVIHDSDFMKLAGVSTKVWEATPAQVSEIDIGSWFDPSFARERAPSLKEVLELASGKVKVVIELKYYGHDHMLEQRVVDLVEQANMENDAAIMSLKYDGIQKVRALRPQWNVGLLSATAIGDLTRLDTDFLAVAISMVSGGFVRRAHEAGKQVFVWTVNDPVSMSRMMSLGVDGIITDEPEMARQVLADRKALNLAERLLIHTALLFGQSFTPRQYRDNSP